MKETWRWFGPLDKINLDDIRQTGAKGIVTSLHEIPYGEVWTTQAIAQRVSLINAAGLSWDVVESLPVHEDIKRGQGDLATLFSNYRQSMANLAAEGVTTICYNFMPLLDWTRTTLNASVPDGGTALRFDIAECAAFDLYMLERKTDEYDASTVKRAKDWWQASTEVDQARLTSSIMAGLPGAYSRYTVVELREALVHWDGFTADDLRRSLARFLAEVIPAADDLGIKMCIHPDDPPHNLFGLPRIVSCADDLLFLQGAETSLSNGITLCSGSLGANPNNNVTDIARQFAARIHFAHLRNVRKEADGSFQESAHLDGDNNMPSIINALLSEEALRRDAGAAHMDIPFRPDHGHELLSDSSLDTHPGYPLVGRLRGLAELRGIIAGLRYARA